MKFYEALEQYPNNNKIQYNKVMIYSNNKICKHFFFIDYVLLPWNPPVSNSHFPMSGRFPRGLGIYVYTALKPV